MYRFQKDKVAFQDAEHDILSCVSDLFNHVHFFHLFLSEASTPYGNPYADLWIYMPWFFEVHGC